MRSFWVVMVVCALNVGCGARVQTHADSKPVAVKQSTYVGVAGAKLYVLLRGHDRRAPVLLWLHGGPGGAERPLFRYFNGELEKHFVVGYWDQRGAGRSFDQNADPRQLTIAQHLDDLDRIVDLLRQRLGVDKIIIVGHSWGTALGLLYARAHADKVSVFVGVNQLVSTLDSQQAQYDFVLAEARRHHDEKALRDVREVGPPPLDTAAKLLALETLVSRCGGVFHKRPNRAWVTVQGTLRGLVTPWEIPRLIRANRVSLDAMGPELLGLDLTRSVTSIDVPVVFFLGRHDRQTDARIAARYFSSLRAPVKRLIWFENSAHNIPFEEPRAFHARILELFPVLRALIGQSQRRVGGPSARQERKHVQ